MATAIRPMEADCRGWLPATVCFSSEYLYHSKISKLMKSLISKLVLIVALLCATSAYAQRNPQMEALLGPVISKVKADSAASVVHGVAELQRLETMYPGEWLPTYYK